jgi:hypothetical protein
MSRHVIRIACIATAALALGTTYALAHQQHTVTRVAIVANPRVYNGACPATIKFTATIFVSRHPAKVTYQWERSDGAKGERQTIDINAAGQGVTEDWQLGGAGEHKTVWERLHVVAPTNITSPQAGVRINCSK